MESQNNKSLITFPLIEDSQTPINVSVCNPTQIKSTISSYTTYTIKGLDEHGEFQVSRRYSQFDIIRQYLLRNWPGCYVPPIPQKKIINKSDQQFVEHRKIHLQQFCKEIASLQHLWFSQEFQTFIRNKNSDLETTLKSLGGDSCQSIIKKYEQRMTFLRGRTIDTLVLNKVLQFHKYLKKIQSMLLNFKEMIIGFLQAKNNNYEQYSILYNYILPQYEKCCLTNYVNKKIDGKIIFTEESDEKMIALIAKIKDIINRRNFNALLLLIDRQERQINAFLQVYKIHANYQKKISQYRQKQKQLELEQQNLNMGKQSLLKSIFKSNIQESKKNIQRNININKEFINNHVFLSDLITMILGFFQIDRFKTTKLINYKLVLKQIAIIQFQFCRAQKALAEHILTVNHLS